MASPTPADEPVFQLYNDVKTRQIKQEELLAVTLGTDVFASTQDGFSDVRLLDEERKPIPYLLQRVKTIRARTVRNTWLGRQPSVRPLEDGGLEITVTLDDNDPHPNGVSLISPLRNFEQRVRVQSSADGQQWEPAGNETVIFDYSRFMDVRSDGVSFPETGKRHFQIVIDDVTAEQESELLALTRRLQGAEETERVERVTIDRRPFRIERIDFWREAEQERATGDEKTQYPVTQFDVEQDPQQQQTIITVDTRREPMTSLQLETQVRNFSRHAVVEVEETRGVKSNWRKIGEGTLSRIDFKNLKREQLSISFPESRKEQYRIVIDNRDSPALDVTGIQGEGNVYRLVFLATPERNYQLVYGAADAEPAVYDTAAVQELLREGFQPAQAELGEQRADPAAGRPAAFKWSELLNDSRLLVGVIALLVIVLGWGLYHAVKRMDNLPSE
jgi:hypothetical protein